MCVLLGSGVMCVGAPSLRLLLRSSRRDRRDHWKRPRVGWIACLVSPGMVVAFVVVCVMLGRWCSYKGFSVLGVWVFSFDII